MPENAPAARPRRSLLRRIVRGCLVLAALLLAGAGAAGGWFWTHRVSYLNRLLDRPGPVRVTLGGLTLDRAGATVSDIELRDASGRDVLLRLPSLRVEADPRGLLERKVQQVTLDRAAISLGDVALERLFAPGSKDQPPGAAGEESVRAFALPGGWTIDRVELNEARLHYERRNGTVAELTLDYEADDVVTSASGELAVGEQELIVRDGSVVRGDVPVTVAELRANGRMRDGILELDQLALERPSLTLRPEIVNLVDTFWGRPAAPDEKAETPPAASATRPGFLRGLRIARLECRQAKLGITGFGPGNPAGLILPQAKLTVDYETGSVAWNAGQPFVPAQQWLRADDIEIAPPSGTGRIACREINLVLPAPENGRWIVGTLTAREPVIHWTADLRRALEGRRTPETATAKAPTPAPTPASSKENAAAGESILLRHAEVIDAEITIADPEVQPLEIGGRATLRISDLALDRAGWQSAAAQSLEVKGLALAYPPPEPGGPRQPFLQVPKAALAIKPDAWNQSQAIDHLSLAQPLLRLRDGNTPWFDGMTGSAAPAADHPPTLPAAPASPALASGPPLWEKLRFGSLLIDQGQIDIATHRGGKRIETQADVKVSTDPARPGQHQMVLANFEARLPGLTLFPFPVARVSTVTCAAALPDLWTQRRLDSLEIRGADIEAGNALMEFLASASASGDATAPAEPAAPAAPVPAPAKRRSATETDWVSSRFSIQDSRVTLDHIVPGMDSVKFQVALSIAEAPLSPEGLASDAASQRVELAELHIPSPYGGPPVAKLDSVFVNFSLAGLMARRIDKVEVLSPTLFIGEPLFWYVDYYRRYASQHDPVPETRIAALDKIFALQAAAATVAAEARAERDSWDLRTLQVHSGKLVIAPKGIPLAGFRTPFPFSFTSELDQGTLHADFQIPADDYEIPWLKLRFEGMSGSVQFNLPVKTRDNNITEVFKVKCIRWRDLHVEDAFLSVTYDLGGIYGKLGSAAYEGYMNGEFNIYNDSDYSWDAWVSGENIQFREVTQKLFPGYFFMEGRVDAKVTAVGDGATVYQTDGGFTNETPGRLSMEALTKLIDRLPRMLSGLKLQLAQISLETLRDFAYDRAEGQFRTYGREGRGTLKFSGPTGTRSFEVNAYDHRWKPESPTDAEVQAER